MAHGPRLPPSHIAIPHANAVQRRSPARVPQRGVRSGPGGREDRPDEPPVRGALLHLECETNLGGVEIKSQMSRVYYSDRRGQ